MELTISQQLIEAVSALLLGVAAGFLYDVFRVIRRRTGSKTVTAVIDFLFWVIAGVLLFAVGFLAGQGRQRVYMTVLAIISATVYFSTLSRVFVLLCEKLVDFILLILKIITWPLVLLVRFLKKIAEMAKKLFQYQRRWYTIAGKGFYSRKRLAKTEKNSTGRGDGNETKTVKYIYKNTNPHVADIRGGKLDKHVDKDRVRPGRARRH
ncbi:MAG: spore cortex biosynthesis protein YabQ [Oscillospiraceae bacterium]|nr:spore cortex biosynthesis protein YabQ [Oscillospiraceae bacterium]